MQSGGAWPCLCHPTLVVIDRQVSVDGTEETLQQENGHSINMVMDVNDNARL